MSAEEAGKESAAAETPVTESPPEVAEAEALKSEPSPSETEDKAAEEEKTAEATKDGEAKSPNKPKPKETKKRVRRVGKTEPRKFAKTQVSSTATEEDVPAAAENDAGAPGPERADIQARRVLSKHDEKWNAMFDKLVAYKTANSHTLVPQCYHDDPRLGRWVHYQRVEYWIFQQSGTGKITPERIGRLEGMGFEWDPQKAQWNMLFDKLVKFKEEVGHCKVPKGYSKDTELANWVRNQRLEQANMKKGKKTRMTEERFQKLDELGFKWSTSIARKGSRKKAAADASKPGEKTTEDDKAKDEAPAPALDREKKEDAEEPKQEPPVDTEVVQI